jgi:hypothetical protein
MGNHTRKERRFLHFCSSNRAWALAQHRALAKGMQDKLLPAFSDIESEANAFADWEYKRLSSLPSADDDFDMDEIAETARDRGIERYEDLAFAEGQLRALAIAGLYHLWERTLKELLVRTLGWEGYSKKQIDKIHRSNFHERAVEQFWHAMPERLPIPETWP